MSRGLVPRRDGIQGQHLHFPLLPVIITPLILMIPLHIFPVLQLSFELRSSQLLLKFAVETSFADSSLRPLFLFPSFLVAAVHSSSYPL